MSFASRATYDYDAVIVGAGPNGLSAAIVLAREGFRTLVVEAGSTPGGGARSLELTLAGFMHDVCSAVHPLGVTSPFFRTLELERYGVEWVESPAPLAHVFDNGSAVILERSVEATAKNLGVDGDAYRKLFEPFVEHSDELMPMILGPLRFPSAPVLLGRFGLTALCSMQGLARTHFKAESAGALLGGIAAHSMVPLDALGSASFALVLGVAAHAAGWPIAAGGSQAITNALVACLQEYGGELELNRRVTHVDELPSARAYLLDVTPRQLIELTRGQLPRNYCRRLQRFRYGPGAFKMDWALDGPIPWLDPACSRAATVHLSGELATLSASEQAVHKGGIAKQPFVLLAQPTLFDPARAPAGKHIAWAYCHVPHASQLDASVAIEAQLERAAPGFRSLVLERSVKSPAQLESYNSNYVGGDINGGIADLSQLFFRPVASLDPYATPLPHVFLCSSSTPPGGGVHGMCGYWAARSALRRRLPRR